MSTLSVPANAGSKSISRSSSASSLRKSVEHEDDLLPASRRNSDSNTPQPSSPGASPAGPPPSKVDRDAQAEKLMQQWQHTGKIYSPTDFHSLQHYLGLYVLAKKADMEPLQNKVMDLIRHYYARERMTSPAFRLEYIYTYVGPCMMRDFLVATAAWRSLSENPTAQDAHVSDSMRGVMVKIPEIAVDYADALIQIHRAGLDPRRGIDCAWHSHEQTDPCPPASTEP